MKLSFICLLGKNNIIKEKIKNGIIQRDNFYWFGITDCNLRGNISIKAWDKPKGINFDKFQNIISDSYRFFILDIWKYPISKETTK